ncbi:MAG TPA: hypothetical protein VHL57_12665, partial [Flavobacteriales bacterium]|nr:hypothetical protein [Flavobacteriales bacterium]
FMALVLGGLVFVGNVLPVPRLRLGLYVAAVVLPMLITGRFRDFTWSALKTLDMSGAHEEVPYTVPIIAHVPRHATTALAGYGERFFSNEIFCAHFSLYGIFRYNVRPVPLISARYLAASAIPRALREERPPDAYDHYAEGTHVRPGQGYTIHHAAACYLNAGWPGLFIGGALIGLFWGWLMRLRQRPPAGSLAVRVFAMLGIACWTAFLPLLVRDGPEAYKGLLFEGFLLPIGTVLLATHVARRRALNPAP